MMITELMPQDIAMRVSPYILGKRLGDITLHIDNVQIHLRNGYWRVPVRPSREPDPLFPYYEMLANIEDEVQEKEGIKVTIASGDPLDDTVTD